MKVGDPVLFVPDCWIHGQGSDTIRACTGPVKRRIIYIHPRRRYYVAEGQVGDCTVREAFQIIPKN